MANKKNDKKEKQVKSSDNNQKKSKNSGDREKNDTLKRSPKQEDL